MTLKEFLDFVGQDSNHFWGFILVLIIVTNGLAQIAKYLFRRKP
jgi:hypothetical protein